MKNAHEFIADLHARKLDYARAQGHEIRLFPEHCTLISCLTREAHYHPVCPQCKATNYANVLCFECKAALEATRPIRASPL